jgi:large subunit ribosomal protein L14
MRPNVCQFVCQLYKSKLMKGTVFSIIDNSGGQLGLCINVFKPRSTHKFLARSLVLVMKKLRSKSSKVKRGQLVRALLVRTNQLERPNQHFWVRFSKMGVVLIGKGGELIGNRIKGLISRRLVKLGLSRIVVLSKYTY